MAWYDDIANTTKGNVMGLVNALRNPVETLKSNSPLYQNRELLASLVRGETQPLINKLNEKTIANPMEAVNVGMGFAPVMGAIVKNPALDLAAKEHFGTTFWPKETGYIMDNGERLDLSGRHYAGGYEKIAGRNVPLKGQPDYLKMDRTVDHRELGDLVPNTGGGWEGLSKFMDESGAVRYMPDYGISLVHTNKPSEVQIQKIVNDYKKSGEPLSIDIDHTVNGGNLASKEFTDPTFDKVKSWLDKQYKLHGDK